MSIFQYVWMCSRKAFDKLNFSKFAGSLHLCFLIFYANLEHPGTVFTTHPSQENVLEAAFS